MDFKSWIAVGLVCFENMKENVFLFIPNLIGMHFESSYLSLECFSELLLCKTFNDSWPQKNYGHFVP